jgi:hypothetical protein
LGQLWAFSQIVKTDMKKRRKKKAKRTTSRVVSLKLRFAILQRDGYLCRYCGKSSLETALEVDHVVPVSAGGETDETNLVTACVDCNRGKRARVLPSVSTFMTWLRAQKLRDDPIGDLADDEARLNLVEPLSYVDLCAQLRAHQACDNAIRAAWDAWREWRRGGKPTKAIQACRTRLLKTIRESVHTSDYVWTKRGMWSKGVFMPWDEA